MDRLEAAEKGHVCAEVNCQRPACAFSFVEGSKRPVCLKHLPTLSSQGLSTFEIAAYEFLETEADHSLYMQRQAQAKQGLQNITALEEMVNSDWREMMRLLEMAENPAVGVVQEVHFHCERCCEAMKHRLSEIRLLLDQLTKDKNAQLNAKDEVLSTGCLFRLVQEEGHSYLEVTKTRAALVPAQAELARLRAVLRVE